MASDDAKYMEEYGPRVVGVLDRLQKAAGVGEVRTRADLDILAAALWELLVNHLSQYAEANARPRGTGLSENRRSQCCQEA